MERRKQASSWGKCLRHEPVRRPRSTITTGSPKLPSWSEHIVSRRHSCSSEYDDVVAYLDARVNLTLLPSSPPRFPDPDSIPKSPKVVRVHGGKHQNHKLTNSKIIPDSIYSHLWKHVSRQYFNRACHGSSGERQHDIQTRGQAGGDELDQHGGCRSDHQLCST